MDDLEEAQRIYEDAISATREQRTQIEEDLRFSDPSNPDQWDPTVKQQRENDPGGARPCLVMDHTGQYVANVAGQVTKNPPAIHTVPVGSESDVKVSEKIDGILRHIEYASRAQTHYGIALTSAARTGVGYLIVRPEYTDRALGYQEPRISSQADPLRVVFDPWSVQLDGSDADFGYLLTSLSEREFKRRYGEKAELRSFGVDTTTRTQTNERTSIVIAEQWYKEEKKRNIIVYVGQDGGETSGTEDEYWTACEAAGTKLEYLRNYTDKYQCVKWRTMSGAAILETPKNEDGTEALYPADAIGIVPVYGYWGVKDGVMTYCGIPRRGMNPQRAYNYHMSEQLAYMGTAPKSPWVAGRRAIAGLEQMWERSAVDSRAALVFNDWDAENNQAIPAPQRSNVTINLQNHLQGAQQALADLEATIGMYRANLGAPSNETSGVAIDARKEQGEAATAHFPQNLAASLGQVGRICVQMGAKLIDTRRQQRILGIDNKPSIVVVDPQQPEAMKEEQDGSVVINPNVGKYDVRVVVGASYSTQRSQAQEALATVMQANPALTPAIAPLWAQQLDFPHADKLAQVLTAMAPEPVQAILNPDGVGKPTLEQVMQKNQQLEQQIQLMQEAGAELQTENQQLKTGEAEKQKKLIIEAYEAETKRLQVLAPAIPPDAVQGIVMQTLQTLMQQPDPLPEGPEPMEYGMPPDQPDPMPPGMEMQQPTEPPQGGFSLPA
jgi:hypothetical protein